MIDYALVQSVTKQIYNAWPVPFELKVSRDELDACRYIIQERNGYIPVSDRGYVLFHGVELIPPLVLQ